MFRNSKIAYFSAEIGLNNHIKTYSGGLGVLAGDTIKAMADLGIPLCAVTLMYRNGYFKQEISNSGRQEEKEDFWEYEKYLTDTNLTITVNIHGEDVLIKVWQYIYQGAKGCVPIFFLDTNVETNSNWMKEITSFLYTGDRISQEIVLGIGGLRALDALGFNEIEKYHMNEGHSVFLTLELYKRIGQTIGWDDGEVRERCIFTTHTPIPAGHDKFAYEEVYKALEGEKDIIPLHIKKLAGETELNTTKLAMSFSSYKNAVSRKHQEVTKGMFPHEDIDYITNGIHVETWASKYMQELFDINCSGWRHDNSYLTCIQRVPNSDIFRAHLDAKKDLIEYVNKHSIVSRKLNEKILTIGFARRFIQYKDAELIFSNIENLKKLGKKVQFIFSGKAHKRDNLGKDIMQRIIDKARAISEHIHIAFLPDYNMDSAKLLVSGCDLWLNTPIPFNEASGTSGMKASVNGCLHFSRLDGWAIEGFERNCGGFPICEYEDFITTLEYKIIPMFYSPNKSVWIQEMKNSIGNAGSYFNTHRMAKEYIEKGYKLKGF